MKDPWEWDQQDLERLIGDKVQESLLLDYKAGAALAQGGKRTENVTKDVSAFANAAGGTLVYGMTEVNNCPAALEGCDPAHISREALDQIIGEVRPRLEGLRIKPVTLRGGPHAGRVAYVVHIPQTRGRAHQAADKKYYKRFEFRSVPMEDYEIQDVARRYRQPDLLVACALAAPRDSISFPPGSAVSRPFAFDWAIRNRSERPADYAVVTLYWDFDFGGLDRSPAPTSRLLQINVPKDAGVAGSKSIPLFLEQHLWHVSQRGPLFSGPTFDLQVMQERTRLTLRRDVPRRHYFVGWEIQAPGMRRRRAFRYLFVRPAETDVYRADLLDEREWPYGD